MDAGRVYAHAKIAQTLLHKPYAASMIIYKLRDPDRAPALAKHFETLFQHEALSWQDREENNLRLFLTLRLSAAITVSLVILLAGFGIFNVLTMSILAKMKEIAILRSMGYRQKDISAIFLWQGAFVAIAGSVIGCAIGALLTWMSRGFRFTSVGSFSRTIFWSRGIGVIISVPRCSRSRQSSSQAMSPPAARPYFLRWPRYADPAPRWFPQVTRATNNPRVVARHPGTR